VKSNELRKRLLCLLVFSSLIASCAPGDSRETRREMGETGVKSVREGRRTSVEPVDGSQEFGGYPCTDDCSGHEAGYQWAQDNGIEQAEDCGGNSDSFIEGCVTYAEERSEGVAEADAEVSDE
jgi:hypothetical protein